MTRRTTKALAVPCMLAAFLSTAWAADPQHAPDGAATSAEIQRLKTQLDQQQKQIEELRAALAAQMKMLEKMTATADAPMHTPPPNQGLMASTAPMVAPALPRCSV